MFYAIRNGKFIQHECDGVYPWYRIEVRVSKVLEWPWDWRECPRCHEVLPESKHDIVLARVERQEEEG